MIPFLAALVLLVGAIAPALAHSQSQLRSLPDDDTSQYCVFTLASNNLILGQIEGGQVVGISQSAAESKSNSSSGGGGDGSSGTIFFLRGEGLYDFAMRGCWWPEPSTVLVCSLQPPAYPDPLFHLDENGQLVYNHTRREFWACPVATGDADDNTHIWSYYLNLPEGRQAGAHGEEVCRAARFDAGVMNQVVCQLPSVSSGSPSVSSSSSSVSSPFSSVSPSSHASTRATPISLSASRSPPSPSSLTQSLTNTGENADSETNTEFWEVVTVTSSVPAAFTTVTVTRGS